MSTTNNKPVTFALRIANWLMDHRVVTAFIVLIPTVILAVAIPRIEVYSKFSDLLPQRHPYIQTYNEMKKTFGGANVVTMSLETTKGDIFTYKTLNKIKFLTDQVDLMPGVNHYQVTSIAHRKIRRMRTTAGGLIKSEPVLPRIIPRDEAKLKQLREAVFNNDIVYGTYVSTDGKAALILAGFDEEKLDYQEIYTRLQELKKQVEKDGETRLYIAGEPMLKGWIYHYSGQMKIIFGITFLIIMVLLISHSRSFTGVFIPLMGTAMSSIWGLGIVGWLGYNLDPLVLVVPILISARTASHCVQMMERYQDELCKGVSQSLAVRASMGELLVPASIAIFTDAAGLLVLTTSSIPIIAKLGVFCAFWSFSNIFTVAIMVPLMLTILPLPRVVSGGGHKHWAAHLMSKWAKFVISQRAIGLILGVTVIIIVGSAYFAKDAVVGENLPGSPILFQNSEYNQAATRINEKFAGSNQFSIYFESKEAHKMKDPKVVRVMEEFAQYMSSAPSYGGVRDIPKLVRSVNRLYHFNDPRWSLIPSTKRNIGNILFMYEAGAAVPGVILQYMDMEAKTANFVVFFKDVTGPTVDAAIKKAKIFLGAHPLEGVKYRFAGGIVGITAAANQEVEHSNLLQTSLIVLVVCLSVMLTYRSLTAALLVFVVLLLAILINTAYMGMRGIGLNVNTLPVTAVGIGIGVDYAIYVLDRIREEVRNKSLDDAISTTLSTTGSAVFFTAVTVIGGIAYWIPGSALRFNSEMAMLLSLLMLSNMIGSVTLLPLLVRIFKPSFVTGGKHGPSKDKKESLAVSEVKNGA